MSDSSQVILVDSHDRELGFWDKIDAHRNPGMLHRASSVFLFHRKQGSVELLIQQRSPFKIVGANQWANSVCGNVRPHESYLECAYRRLREELGIFASSDHPLDLHPLYKFQYHIQCSERFSENEIDQVFACWYDGPITPVASEVIDIAWIDWEKLEISSSEINQTRVWAPWFALIMSKPDLSALLNDFVHTTENHT